MSEQEQTVLEKISEEYDKKYARMQTFLITILGIVFSAFVAIGASQISSGSSVKKQVEINTSEIKEIKDNGVTKKAIDNLIMTFENQTTVMERFLPNDVQGAIKEFNRVSSEQRSLIIMYNNQ
jgi:hypothetical protein